MEQEAGRAIIWKSLYDVGLVKITTDSMLFIDYMLGDYGALNLYQKKHAQAAVLRGNISIYRKK